MEELNLNPRDYQKAIFETCKEKDCLVILPTGTGKTLIAIMTAIDRFKKYPLQKVLMLAPTRPLIEQHLESFKKTLPENYADMQLFTGKTKPEKRKEIWQTAEFIFSTPQCISNDIEKNLYDLSEVSLLIIDECHRCLKNYAYNKIAQKYKVQAKNPRIIGLTASPGSDQKRIREVCQNLGISAVEIRTRESPDVKPYLQKLEVEKIEVEFPEEFNEIKKILKEMFEEKIQELKNRNINIYNSSKISLLKIQKEIIEELKRGKDYHKMKALSTCSQALKIAHAIELIETQALSSFINYMKELYKQSSEKKSKAVQKLTKDKRFSKAFSLSTTLPLEHPKISKLKEIVKEQIRNKKDSKIIIFAQFRETVKKINDELNKIDGVKSIIFVGQAIKKHQDEKITGLKQKEQKEIIEKFKRGEINTLVATSIAEEGLDIPEVSQVIFYESVPSAIRKIQRAGRTARLFPGSIKLLVTKKTLDEIYHYSSYYKEKKMHKAIEKIKKEFEKKEESQKKLFNDEGL